MTSRQAGRSALVAVASVIALLGVSADASAQAFGERPLTVATTVPLLIDSVNEFPMGFGNDYLANLDMRRRIIANSWVRSVLLAGPSLTGFAARRLSADECREFRRRRAGFPCTPIPPGEGDRLEAYWGWNYLVRQSLLLGDALNRPSAPQRLAASPDGANSMLFPGIFFRFFSNHAPTYVSPTGAITLWSTYPPGDPSGDLVPRGEDSGFRVESVVLQPSIPAARGHQHILNIAPYERVSGVLLGGRAFVDVDSVSVAFDHAFPRQTVAVWVDPGSAPVRAIARCGAMPTLSAYAVNVGVSPTRPGFLDLGAFPGCGAPWVVSVVNFGSAPAAFHLRVGTHHASRERRDISVGIESATSGPAEDAFIRQVVREAAWRFYGVTGGTQLLRDITYRAPGVCDRVTICFRNRPRGGTGGCVHNSAIANPVEGNAHICWDAVNFTGAPNVSIAAAMLSHEFTHLFTGTIASNHVHDEYHRGAYCGSTLLLRRCMHSTQGGRPPTLVSYCTDATHNSVTEVFAPLVPALGSPIGVTSGGRTYIECTVITTAVDGRANAAWTHLWNVGVAPAPHPRWSADNHNFVNFANSTLVGIGRNLN